MDLIINVALTGCVATVEDNIHLPVTPRGIAADTQICAGLGAQVFHIHARDEQQQPTWKRGYYQQIVDKIRRFCPQAIICVSCSGRYWGELEKRQAALDVNGIDMASLTLGSFNFKNGPSVNALDTIRALLEKMNEKHIRPELEVFDLGMVDVSKQLIADGLLQPPYYYNLFFGNPGTMAANLTNLAVVVSALPPGSIWSVAGLGRWQWQMNCLGIIAGGHVRTGLEDNLKYDKDILASNGSLVFRLIELSTGYGRGLMPITEVRKCLSL